MSSLNDPRLQNFSFELTTEKINTWKSNNTNIKNDQQIYTDIYRQEAHEFIKASIRYEKLEILLN